MFDIRRTPGLASHRRGHANIHIDLVPFFVRPLFFFNAHVHTWQASDDCMHDGASTPPRPLFEVTLTGERTEFQSPGSALCTRKTSRRLSSPLDLSRHLTSKLYPWCACVHKSASVHEKTTRTMWGFIRVENEHLRIYGAPDGPPDSDSGDPVGAGFKHIPSCASSVSTMAGSSINSGGSPSASGGSGGRSVGGSRVSGLDRLPYSRMDMPSRSSRATNPVKAWCLTRVS